MTASGEEFEKSNDLSEGLIKYKDLKENFDAAD